MPVDNERLQEFMERYFGPMGDFLLTKEMKVLGVNDLHVAGEDVRRKLVDCIVSDCLLTVMSYRRAMMARNELESIMDVSNVPLPGIVRQVHR